MVYPELSNEHDAHSFSTFLDKLPSQFITRRTTKAIREELFGHLQKYNFLFDTYQRTKLAFPNIFRSYTIARLDVNECFSLSRIYYPLQARTDYFIRVKPDIDAPDTKAALFVLQAHGINGHKTLTFDTIKTIEGKLTLPK